MSVARISRAGNRRIKLTNQARSEETATQSAQLSGGISRGIFHPSVSNGLMGADSGDARRVFCPDVIAATASKSPPTLVGSRASSAVNTMWGLLRAMNLEHSQWARVVGLGAMVPLAKY